MAVDYCDRKYDDEDDNCCISSTLLWIELDYNSWHCGIDTFKYMFPIGLRELVVDYSSPISSTNILKSCTIPSLGNIFNTSTSELP